MPKKKKPVMPPKAIYFATNRNPLQPPKDGSDFGIHLSNPPTDLRFGKVTLIGGYETTIIFDEQLINKIPDPDPNKPQVTQEVLGSFSMFKEIHAELRSGKDLIIYIHGYNNDFKGAVDETFTLLDRYAGHPAVFVLFSWPSDGSMAKRAYYDDRLDAEISGVALGRGLQKMAHFLKELSSDEYCRQKIHLIAHSMGVYALRHAVQSVMNTTHSIRRIFDEILLFAADEDTDALANSDKLGPLTQFAKRISVYINSEDKALMVSDKTKRNPERLGADGPENTRSLSDKISVISCDRVSDLLNDIWGHHYIRKVDIVRNDALEVLSGKATGFTHRSFDPETRRYFLFK
jgi:esterase/lipase superfamily enzyme